MDLNERSSLEWRSYARRSLFLGHSCLSLSLSLSLFLSLFLSSSSPPPLSSFLTVFAAFQSGKFSNAITLPPCVCLDKSIMRFYASCACFHWFLGVVYAPARRRTHRHREKIFEEARFSIHRRASRESSIQGPRSRFFLHLLSFVQRVHTDWTLGGLSFWALG